MNLGADLEPEFSLPATNEVILLAIEKLKEKISDRIEVHI